MPFKSEAQRKFMHAKHPGIAKRWEDEGGTAGHLPAHARDTKGKYGGGDRGTARAHREASSVRHDTMPKKGKR